MRSTQNPPRTLPVLWTTSLAVVSLLLNFGCATTDSRSADEVALHQSNYAAAQSDLKEAPFTVEKTVSAFPKVVARTKVSSQRVEVRPVEQEDGLRFPNRAATVVGYPAVLELTNEDSVVVEVTDLEIRRRSPHLVGNFEDLIGTDPIVLQPGESWTGNFVVSRKEGWYRVRVQSSAPDGWTAIPGPNTQKVYFREETNANLDGSGYSVTITFWNLREDTASFRYWVTAEDGHGVPKSSFADGVMEISSGEAIEIKTIADTRKWSLVTAPVDGNSSDGGVEE